MLVLSSVSSSCVLVILLCFSSQDQCSGRHLGSVHDHAMDNKPKLLNHSSTIKGVGYNDSSKVHDVLDIKMTARGNNQTNNKDNDHQKQTDSGSKNKKDMIKDQKVKKFKELDHHHHPKSAITNFRVPIEHRKIHQQPCFNLDYSPPKTHPPSHN
ncbi:hypothetical protein E3N88_16904 [Mikania micrantha]|uniref:Uncharacterized protein n=1 Tax=Mikania micrantha TaxID=192012 RepID=A0A5N6NSZ3_9ASTR|nr:hypothetical protein E3N88_16904 [Mikania micrantha]